MLCCKAWRESRSTFLWSVLLLFLYCAGEILVRQYARARGISPDYHEFVTAQIFSGPGKLLFVVVLILLGQAGLLRERSQRRAVFTLSLPVRRHQFLGAQLGVGLMEMAMLAVLPGILIGPLSSLMHHSYPVSEALRFSLLRFISGTEIFALAFVISTVVRGMYAAPIACFLALLVQVRAANWHPLTYGLNPLVAMDWGRSVLNAGKPLPWVALALLTLIAIALFAVAGFITERQNI